MNATGPVEALVGLDVGTAEVLLGVHVLSDFTDGGFVKSAVCRLLLGVLPKVLGLSLSVGGGLRVSVGLGRVTGFVHAVRVREELLL